MPIIDDPIDVLVLNRALAERFADLALRNIQREFPAKLDHVINDEHDLQRPRMLHPVFYGSFDWHSCVHMHWLLVRLIRCFPDLSIQREARRVLALHFAPESVAGELAYLAQSNRTSFERPYGWAWLLKLMHELISLDDEDARSWARALQPLADVFVERYIRYLPKATYPVRHGTHANSAFGLSFAYDYAKLTQQSSLRQLIEQKTVAWFSRDQDYSAQWEPSGEDFLSPALVEADLLRRILPPAEFSIWLNKFLPGLREGYPGNLFTPVITSDRSDLRIVHLDGLNLSRAWCWRSIAQSLSLDDIRRVNLMHAAKRHAEAALPQVLSGEYSGEHWLASFAVYYLTEEL